MRSRLRAKSTFITVERHHLTIGSFTLKKKVWRDVLYLFTVATLGSAAISYSKQEPFVSPVPHVYAQEPAQSASTSGLLDFLNPMQFVESKPTVVFTAPLSPTPTETPTPTPSPYDWNYFISAAKRIAPIYNYPVKVLIAQAAVESAHGSSNYAINRNNYFGIGAFDWNPDNAYSFENPEQCIIEYMLLIRNNFPEAWANRQDAKRLLQLLENNSSGSMYATDPAYVFKVMNTPEWSNN